MYFLLFGLAAIFFFSSANVLPTARNNRKYIESHLQMAVDAYYAHRIVIKRMIDIIEEGRAVEVDEALAVLKNDLRALNSSVAVEQEEYDEVVTIKPMFLVRDYQ